ncbi:hypothetical protein ACFX1X_047653 [Malus domestica]|nr:U-box domain-containing protein 21-like [Malus domestica]
MDVGEIAIPTHFWFLISLDLMKDPVTLSTGITYDRSSIEKWIETGNNTCSVTNQELMSFDQILNHALCRIIQDWCVENKSYGIERIPMPRILVIPYEVSRIRERIMGAARHLNEKKCRELVGKIKEWGGLLLMTDLPTTCGDKSGFIIIHGEDLVGGSSTKLMLAAQPDHLIGFQPRR